MSHTKETIPVRELLAHFAPILEAWIKQTAADEIQRLLEEDKELSLKEVAERYPNAQGKPRSLKTMYNWVSQGRLPVRASGLVRLSDLQAMEADGVRPGKAEAERWVRQWKASNI